MTKAERRKKIAFLKGYKWIMLDLNADRERLDDMKDRVYSVRTPKLSDMPRGGRPVTMEDNVIDMIELEEYKIPNRKEEAERMKRVIEQAIEDMEDPRDRTILKLKFIHDYTHEQIAEYIHYSTTQEYVFYNQALEHFVIP